MFRPDEWILVGDPGTCPWTRMQIRYLRETSVPLHGAILCGDNPTSETCAHLEYFPAFCNTRTQVCVPGYRDTPASFEELAAHQK